MDTPTSQNYTLVTLHQTFRVLPPTDARTLRGLALAATSDAIQVSGENSWWVKASKKGRAPYSVSFNPWTQAWHCACVDHERGNHCKHVRAVRCQQRADHWVQLVIQNNQLLNVERALLELFTMKNYPPECHDWLMVRAQAIHRYYAASVAEAVESTFAPVAA